MNKSTSTQRIFLNNDAEGEPDPREILEPASPFRTSVMPIVQDDVRAIHETGVHVLATLQTDGNDATEVQDASLTKDETKLDTKHETEAQSRGALDRSKPILIVEDTVELGEVIQATLEGMGLQAVHETHGKSGLERLRDIEPELVVLDIGLPDMSGWKILDHIKEHFTSIHKPMPSIIVITAYGDPANRLIGKLQKIHSYLIKPFTPDEVEKVVNMALSGEQPPHPHIGGDIG